jgi:hypothetical protein
LDRSKHPPRCVRVHDDARLLVADAWELLVGLQHRARLVVVKNERPELLCRNVRRQMQIVGLATRGRFHCAVQVNREGAVRLIEVLQEELLGPQSGGSAGSGGPGSGGGPNVVLEPMSHTGLLHRAEQSTALLQGIDNPAHKIVGAYRR